MSYCIVRTCRYNSRNNNKENLKFHKLPTSYSKAKEWIDAADNPKITASNFKFYRICSIHFQDKYLVRHPHEVLYGLAPPISFRGLTKEAIPTLHLPDRSGTLQMTVDIPDKEIYAPPESSCVLSNDAAVNSPDLPDAVALNLPDLPSDATLDLPASSVQADKEKLQQETVEKYENIISKMNAKMMLMKKKLITKEKKIKALRKSKACLQQNNKKLQLDIKNSMQKSAVVDSLSTVFTPKQVDLLLNPGKTRTAWTEDDISTAITAHNYGHRAYEYWRTVRKLPLPAPSTMRFWISELKLAQGILSPVLQAMNIRKDTLDDVQRLTVIGFDDIHLSAQTDFNKKKEQVVGTHKTCMTVMARGLVYRWKQPVYYKYDDVMTKESFCNIVTTLYTTGYPVVATVCDLGPNNRTFLKSMGCGIGADQTCFVRHPSNENLKIFMFADFPHMMKLLRNHFLDTGFIFKDAVISTKSLWTLVQHSEESDLTVTPSLVEKMLKVKGSERKKVKWAVKLLSNSVAKALRFLGEKGYLTDDPFWEQTAEFIQLSNDWFDVCNSHSKFGRHDLAHGYGVNLEKQDDVINRMTVFMEEMRAIVKTNSSAAFPSKKSALIPFQKGIILSNRSLQGLLQYLQEQYHDSPNPISYILTRRVNQDINEQSNATFRAMGARHEKMSALEFKYRMHNYILGLNAAPILSSNAIEHAADNEDDETLVEFFNPDESPERDHLETMCEIVDELPSTSGTSSAENFSMDASEVG